MTSAASISTGKTASYLAKSLKLVAPQHLDNDKFLSANWMSVQDEEALIRAGKIWNPKTICALYYARINELL